MDLPTLQVLVTEHVARAPEVARHAGLPEQIAEEAASRCPDDQAAACKLARFLAGVGFRESALSWLFLTADGHGEDLHGWDEWQVDDRSHPAEVEEIRALPPRSPERRRVALHHGCTVLLAALDEFPGNDEAGLCRYNASRGLVLKGLIEGDPNKYTTGHNYGRDVLRWIGERWTASPSL